MLKNSNLYVPTLIAVIAAATLSQASAQTPPQQEMLEHWRRATISLGRLVSEGGQQRYATLGSAVFAAVDERHGCILTAKHMVFGPSDGWIPTEIRMRLPRNDASPDPDLGVNIPLIENNQPIWKSLGESDLAVMPAPDLSRYTDLHAVSVNDFGASEDDVFQGAPVVVLGYPGVIGESPLSFPIARSGIVAWTDPADRLGRPFLVDGNVMPGNSGGPVFHVRTGLGRFGGFTVGGGLALVGIVSKVPLQDVKIATQPTFAAPTQTLQFQLKGIGGIGIVEPASKAKQLVQQSCGPSK
jgi:hypothetical protein